MFGSAGSRGGRGQLAVEYQVDPVTKGVINNDRRIVLTQSLPGTSFVNRLILDTADPNEWLRGTDGFSTNTLGMHGEAVVFGRPGEIAGAVYLGGASSFGAHGIQAGAVGHIGWSSVGAASNSSDTGMFREAPGVIAFRTEIFSSVDTVENMFTLQRITSGTPAVGIGVGMSFDVETSASNIERGGKIEVLTTDVGAGTEDFDLRIMLMQGGATATEQLRIASNGKLYLGHFADVNAAAFPSQFQSAVTASSRYAATFVGYGANANPSAVAFMKSRTGTFGNHAVVNSADMLMKIDAYGSDGTDFASAGYIAFEVDGTPGNNDMPGRFVVATSPDASETPAVRMTISNAGHWLPGANDVSQLGSTSLQFADLFLAEGAVINFDNGDLTLTQTGNLLAVAGGALRVQQVQDTVTTLTDGASVALDAQLGNTFKLVAAGNRTILAPTNAPASGFTQRIIIMHEASGADRTLALTTGSAGSFRFGTSITALTATTNGLVDYIGCVWNQADDRWDVVSYVKGY